MKSFHETRNDFLKFILQEAKTNFGNSAKFQDEESGDSFMLHYEPSSGEFKVEKL